MFGNNKRRIKELEILKSSHDEVTRLNRVLNVVENDCKERIEGKNKYIHELSIQIQELQKKINAKDLTLNSLNIENMNLRAEKNTPQQTAKEQKAIKEIQQQQREFFLSDKTVQDKVEMLFDDMIISLSELTALRNPKTSIEKFIEILSKIDMRYLNLGRE